MMNSERRGNTSNGEKSNVTVYRVVTTMNVGLTLRYNNNQRESSAKGGQRELSSHMVALPLFH
jgi:hypothetical protein